MSDNDTLRKSNATLVDAVNAQTDRITNLRVQLSDRNAEYEALHKRLAASEATRTQLIDKQIAYRNLEKKHKKLQDSYDRMTEQYDLVRNDPTLDRQGKEILRQGAQVKALNEQLYNLDLEYKKCHAENGVLRGEAENLRQNAMEWEESCQQHAKTIRDLRELEARGIPQNEPSDPGSGPTGNPRYAEGLEKMADRFGLDDDQRDDLQVLMGVPGKITATDIQVGLKEHKLDVPHILAHLIAGVESLRAGDLVRTQYEVSQLGSLIAWEDLLGSACVKVDKLSDWDPSPSTTDPDWKPWETED